MSQQCDFQIVMLHRLVGPFVVGRTVHPLTQGLTDMPWAMVFGPPYIQLFLQERLL